ncbi:MAG TPA: cupin domain-containing protein [Proteobacteria bacterium]|nr:cupin domain-containing protein [Pseudomonadota bacterium]
MEEAVCRQKLDEEFYTPEKCHIIEVSNSPADPELSLARARVEPGVTTRWHRLKGVAERYVMVAGTGLVEIGRRPPRKVNPGDVVLIPPGCRQRIANPGPEELIFFAICTPRFTPEAYEELEGETG